MQQHRSRSLWPIGQTPESRSGVTLLVVVLSRPTTCRAHRRQLRPKLPPVSLGSPLLMTAASTPDGLIFGPTANGRMYLSTYEHRGRNRVKSRWADDLDPPEEYSIFDRADASDHSDSNGHFWGIRDPPGAVLGTRGERLAKFPFNAVPAVPWHGFPVSPASGRASEIPPDELVDFMIGAGAISRTLGRKLQRRKA
jgi:hypothetical protein